MLYKCIERDGQIEQQCVGPVRVNTVQNLGNNVSIALGTRDCSPQSNSMDVDKRVCIVSVGCCCWYSIYAYITVRSLYSVVFVLYVYKFRKEYV